MGLIFIGSFTVALSGALAPGPFLTMVIARSLERGPWTGPLAVLGHMFLELALLLLLVLGLGRLLGQPVFMVPVFLAGGAILLWMAADLLRNAGKMSAGVSGAADAGPRRLHPVLAGAVVSLSNPYWLVWWLVIGLGLVMQSLKFGPLGVAVFFAGHILADLAWYSLVSFSVAAGKKFISGNAYRIIVTVCGLVLLGFGCWFLYGGIVKWLGAG